MYPTIRDSGAEDLEGDEFLGLEENEQDYLLSWAEVQRATSYRILEDNESTVQNKLRGSIRSDSVA